MSLKTIIVTIVIQTIILVPTLNNKILILIHLALQIKTDTPPVITTTIDHNIKTIIMLNLLLHQTIPCPLGKLASTRPTRTCTVSLPQSPQLCILTHPLDLNHEVTPPPNYRPEISLKLFNNSYNALLDSGASVSAISEELFQNLTLDPSQHKIPLFPLTGVLLTTALSNKSVKIKSQIYLTFSINNYETFGIFLVVPQLSTSIILGTDWLLENGVTIDYNAKEISLPSVTNNIPFKLIVDHDPDSLANSLKNINISNKIQ